jgi:hypothetical protein
VSRLLYLLTRLRKPKLATVHSVKERLPGSGTGAVAESKTTSKA